MSEQTDQDRAARLATIRRHHDYGAHCSPERSDECFLLAEVDRLADERDRARREALDHVVAQVRELLDHAEMQAESARVGKQHSSRMIFLGKREAYRAVLIYLGVDPDTDAPLKALAAGGEPGEAG